MSDKIEVIEAQEDQDETRGCAEDAEFHARVVALLPVTDGAVFQLLSLIHNVLSWKEPKPNLGSEALMSWLCDRLDLSRPVLEETIKEAILKILKPEEIPGMLGNLVNDPCDAPQFLVDWAKELVERQVQTC